MASATPTLNLRRKHTQPQAEASVTQFYTAEVCGQICQSASAPTLQDCRGRGVLATCCRASSGRRSHIQRCVPNSGAARRRCTSNNRVKRRSCHCCCCCCCRCQLDCRAKSCHQRAYPASGRLRRQLNNCRGCRRVAGGKKARAGCGEGLTRLPGGLRSRRARHARREDDQGRLGANHKYSARVTA